MFYYLKINPNLAINVMITNHLLLSAERGDTLILGLSDLSGAFIMSIKISFCVVYSVGQMRDFVYYPHTSSKEHFMSL